MDVVDLVLRAGGLIVSLVAIGVSIAVYRAGARRKELDALKDDIKSVDDRTGKAVGEVAHDLVQHKEAGQDSRAELRERLVLVEQHLAQMPDRDSVHKLALDVTENPRRDQHPGRDPEGGRGDQPPRRGLPDAESRRMTDYATHVAEDCRLIILRTLHAETSGTTNEVLLQRALETFGHTKTRDYVRTQVRALKDLGAVSIREAGTVMIATITRAGIDHVERRGVIEGVLRPSPEG